MSYAFSRFLFSAILPVFALTACQTAPISSSRSPATTNLNPKFLELVREDAIEALGLYTESVLLAQNAERVRLAQNLQAPIPLRFDSRSVGFTSTAMIAGPAFFGYMSGVSSHKYDGAASTRTAGKFIALGGAGAGLIVGTIVYTSNFYDGTASLPNDESSGSNDPKNNVFAFVHRSIRPGDAKAKDQSVADAANAGKQAEFVGGLKRTSAEVARRAGLLFRLNRMETTRFQYLVEDRMLEGFSADRVWKPGDEVQVDISSLLRTVVPNGTERLETLGRILDASGQEKVVAPESDIDLLEWLVGAEKDIRELEATVISGYVEVREEKTPAFKEVAAKYERLGNELDAFADKLATHAILLRSEIEKRGSQ